MRRSPARFLAPIALVAFAVALYSVVHDSGDPNGSPSGGSSATATPTSTTKSGTKKKSTSKKRKTYTVKSGDTLSGIAEKTGVSLETLNDLNPDVVDTLSPGQKLRLR
jgi:LysM repeat protein